MEILVCVGGGGGDFHVFPDIAFFVKISSEQK